MLRNIATFAFRSLVNRYAPSLGRLINQVGQPPEFGDLPVYGSEDDSSESEPGATTEPVVTSFDELEHIAPPSSDITTTKKNECLSEPPAPTVEPIAECEPPTRQCRNRKHPDTGHQCTNRVWLDIRSGLCEECARQCQGCDREIPIQYSWCKRCQDTGKAFKHCRNCEDRIQFHGPDYCASCMSGTKPCKGQCGAKLPFIGPGYCNKCGHGCAGTGCSAVIPNYFSHCMADNCQTELMMKRRRIDGTSPGAKAWAKKKADRSQKDKDLRDSMKAGGPRKKG